MSSTAPFRGTVARTRGWAAPVRYAAAALAVLGAFLSWQALDGVLPLEEYPFTPFLAAVLLSATLFGQGCGFFAIALCLPLISYFYMPPVGTFALNEAEAVAVAFFIAMGAAMALVVEAFHKASANLSRDADELRRLVADLNRAERARALLLREFRHRARNDINALVGLLALRARAAPSEAARDALREAADHARALARVHARLAQDGSGGEGGAPLLDTREFVAGLCADLQAAQAGEGLRPVALLAEAEAHALNAERAVPLGLVLNEAVTNALKYAFPEERAGTVRVRFAREGGEFVLTVSDDGVGLPAEEPDRASSASLPRGSGLGTRLLRALAAQLRGSFARRPGEGGVGTAAELRFPAEASGAPDR